ncbi:uncharacterized protein LOC121705556 [Alosa sapidissima]|uniref:uncharacterized protein LOC121705556 n=1 Tax=Alosa sapidissima TaxID=34773 RepID=UPI001C08F743|nr:uncharacterized protein LOC121705556 [Alosa sapidissima]
MKQPLEGNGCRLGVERKCADHSGSEPELSPCLPLSSQAHKHGETGHQRSFASLPGVVCVCVCVCVCGAVDNVRVWPGQDVVVRCETGSASGSYTQWLQVCPPQVPRFVQQSRKFSFKKSAVHGCYDLHVSGVASADVCLYFFALVEKDQKCDYMFQRTQTRLTLADSVPVVFDPSCPPVPEGGCSLPWTLLLIAGCLLSTLLALTWAHRICCNTGTGQREEEATGAEYQVDVCKYHQCEKTLRGLDCLHTEVTYRLIPMEASQPPHTPTDLD